MTRCEQNAHQGIIHFEDTGDMSKPLALDTVWCGVNNKLLKVTRET